MLIEDIHLEVENRIRESASQIVDAIIQNVNREEDIPNQQYKTPADYHSKLWYITSTMGSSKSFYMSTSTCGTIFKYWV